ncbi:hypothetical protein DB29_00480 [Shouchella clausii]|nr:hypothetical protein DB29_00480 [Shouchella clausii]
MTAGRHLRFFCGQKLEKIERGIKMYGLFQKLGKNTKQSILNKQVPGST